VDEPKKTFKLAVGPDAVAKIPLGSEFAIGNITHEESAVLSEQFKLDQSAFAKVRDSFLKGTAAEAFAAQFSQHQSLADLAKQTGAIAALQPKEDVLRALRGEAALFDNSLASAFPQRAELHKLNSASTKFIEEYERLVSPVKEALALQHLLDESLASVYARTLAVPKVDAELLAASFAQMERDRINTEQPAPSPRYPLNVTPVQTCVPDAGEWERQFEKRLTAAVRSNHPNETHEEEMARRTEIAAAEERARLRVRDEHEAEKAKQLQQVPAKRTKEQVQAKKEDRQERRLKLCLDAGLKMPTTARGRMPYGIGKVAENDGVERQTFTEDVKAALARKIDRERPKPTLVKRTK
jgi:hypothetical protein